MTGHEFDIDILVEFGMLPDTFRRIKRGMAVMENRFVRRDPVFPDLVDQRPPPPLPTRLARVIGSDGNTYTRRWLHQEWP